MGQFGITQARGRLGFTPSTSTPINLDARGTGGTGAAVGQALVAGLGIAQKIHQKRQQMTDANSNVTANGFRSTADQEFEAYKLTNPQETWVAKRQELNKRVDGEIGTLQFSKGATEFQRTKSQAISQVNSATALTSATRQLRTDTTDALTQSMITAFESGDQAKIAEATRMFANQGDNMGKDDNEVIADIKAARTVGTISNMRNKIALFPEETKAELEAELESRRSTGSEPEDELSSKNISALIKSANVEISQRKTKDEKVLNESAAKVEPDWNTKWANGTLKTDEILAWKPPLTDADAIREHVDIQQEWINKLGAKTGKGNGWAAVMQDVDLNPNKWTPTRIYAQSPKLITSEDAAKMVTHWRSLTKGDSTGSNTLHSRYQSILTAQAKVGAFGKAGKEDSVNATNDMSRQLTDFKVNHPEATTDQWNKFYDSLTENKKDSNFISKAFRKVFFVASNPDRFVLDEINKFRTQLKESKASGVPPQQVEVGREVTDKGGTTWVLINKGKTPAEDVWQKQ